MAPNFPRPPVAPSPIDTTIPSDLVANGRNFYTEIHFVDFRSAKYGEDYVNLLEEGFLSGPIDLIRGVGDAIVGGVNLVPGFGGFASNLIGSTTAGLAIIPISLTPIRLPIPININDVMVFNWDTPSLLDIAAGINPVVKTAIDSVQIAGAFAGKAVNPLLYVAFNRPNFRNFRFEWNLVPKNKKESETIKKITETFKYAASPEGLGGPILDYPLIAQVRMFPNNLNDHAHFLPMAIKGVSVNLTPNPAPSFFGPEEPGEDPKGAPTMVNLSVEMMEIELWDRSKINKYSKIIG
jgi:hypothetical protein